MDETSTPDYEFGGFRLDTSLQVLVSPSGEAVPLPSRAFATLRYLVERSGELVDKSALMATVWPKTVVAENNLSQCILALRKAFGESAGERRFILTVPGRGFKFVAPVRVVQHGDSTARRDAAATADVVASRWTSQQRRWFKVSAGIAGLVVVGTSIWLWNTRQHLVTSPAEYEPLTDVTDSATAPVLSPDGRMLAFVRNSGWLPGSGQIWLKVLPDGEPVQLTRALGNVFAPVFTPDDARVSYSVSDPKLNSWDTWTIPVTGVGEPTKLLPNATGLTYFGQHEVMYSEFKGGIHLGIVTSMDDRSHHRDIYVPSHERGMAHLSYLSPDKKSVLVAEMGSTGEFQNCRLVPFDGSSAGHAVGPNGRCTSAAWSPDGQWMYFSVMVEGHWHLWRQGYPNGKVQQITFGPTGEESVAVAPDGHALLTSIGATQTSLWFHGAQGERILTTEGGSFSPWLSSDARRVYFLSTRNSTTASELSRLDIDSGSRESLLPGFSIVDYDVSVDEQQVVFSTLRDSVQQVWIAPLDRHAPPRLLARGGDQVAFGGGYVFFRSIGEHANFLHRINPDGSNEVRVLPDAIDNFFSVAPDGKCVRVDLPAVGGLAAAWLIPLGPGAPRRMIGNGFMPSRWSHDGRALYIEVPAESHSTSMSQTVVLPTGSDGLPIGPAPILPVSTSAPTIPLNEESLAPGPDPSVYAFLKSEQRWNIYRIPLH